MQQVISMTQKTNCGFIMKKSFLERIICAVLGGLIGFMVPWLLSVKFDANKEWSLSLTLTGMAVCGFISFWKGQLLLEKLAKAMYWLINIF